MSAPRRIRTWAVATATAVVALGSASSAAAAPAISGSDGDLWSTAPTYTVSASAPLPARARFRWSGSNGQVGTSQVVPFTVVLDQGPPDEGPGTLTVTQQAPGTAAETVTRSFVVDLTPPGAVTLAVPATAPAGTEIPVSWTGGEPGARFTLRVRRASGEVVQGPAESLAAAARVVPLAAGAYVVGVVQTDAAGNAGPETAAALTIAPAPVPAFVPPAVQATVATPRRPGYRLPAANASRLRPRAAARVTGRRPILRWSRAKGTRFYNVQVFRVDARVRTRNGAPRLLKVRSLFPRGQRLRAPLLARGACYVWRVWPYGRSGFTRTPLGLSNFCVTTARSRR